MPSKSSDPRQQAIRNLHQVLQGRSLDQVLSAPTAVADREHAFVAELSYGLCRWYRLLDTLVSGYLLTPHTLTDGSKNLNNGLETVQTLFSPLCQRFLRLLYSEGEKMNDDCRLKFAPQTES